MEEAKRTLYRLVRPMCPERRGVVEREFCGQYGGGGTAQRHNQLRPQRPRREKWQMK